MSFHRTDFCGEDDLRRNAALALYQSAGFRPPQEVLVMGRWVEHFPVF